MHKLIIGVFLISTLGCSSQVNEEAKIKNLLEVQAQSWNKGDLEGFMQTYWKSDSLMFIGKSGVTRGWQKTLDNYKLSYPDTSYMGKLNFDLVKIERVSDEHYFVVGKWMLTRQMGDVSGHFTLLIRRINGAWKIVADHSS